jgi:hypothetical protein
MGKMIKYAELQKQYELEPARCEANLMEAIEAGDLKPRDFSFQGLFDSLVPGGKAFREQTTNYRKSGRSIPLIEAANATDLSAFSNITGQIIFSEIKEAMANPEFIFPTLVDSRQTPFPYGERIPGVGKVGDKTGYVGEGELYPTAGPNEEYVDISPTVKSGLITNVTREAVEFDMTGKVLDEARDLGYSYGLALEKKGLDVCFGITNSYRRNGVATNTYLTTGSYINSVTSGLAFTDWTSVQSLELLFDSIVDPNTGEPVMLRAATLVVPSALKRSANRVLMASEIQHVDNTASANTIRTISQNQLDTGFYGSPRYNVASNAYVHQRTGSATKWFFGDFKRAFRRYYNWDKEITQAADNNEMKFTHDIWARTKVSTRDIVAVLEPRYVASGNA